MIIERKEYLEKLIAWKDKQLIKIVTGVRRCGKSMLLEIYRNYLKEHGIEEEMCIRDRPSGTAVTICIPKTKGEKGYESGNYR